jgi:5-methylcytosine-specific restriction enzyme subunit McrC
MSTHQRAPFTTTAVEYTLREYEATPYLDEDELPEVARTAVEREINGSDTASQSQRVQLEYRADGRARLRATQYVGIIALPEGPTIEIRPKVPDTDLLGLLRYAQGIEARTFDQQTRVTGGARFIDALATLFETELDRVLTQGLHRTYSRVSQTTDHVRGRINVQAQLQRQGPTPTAFECTYDELTVDTTVNQAVLYATTVLQRLTTDSTLTRALQRHQQQLRRQVELRQVRSVEIERIELTRLMSYYEDLLRLTKLVLQSVHLESLRTADRDSYALLVDMNRIFEAVVERVVSELAADRGWTATTQASSTRLVTGGHRRIQIRPDIVVSDGERDRLVGDAKWKLDEPGANQREPAASDIYQLVAYQVAHETPGVIFYPEQPAAPHSVYEVHNLEELTLVEIPVNASDATTLPVRIRDRVAAQLPW